MKETWARKILRRRGKKYSGADANHIFGAIRAAGGRKAPKIRIAPFGLKPHRNGNFHEG
jgi:hypothetical protein